jgi:hypothetical protein
MVGIIVGLLGIAVGLVVGLLGYAEGTLVGLILGILLGEYVGAVGEDVGE